MPATFGIGNTVIAGMARSYPGKPLQIIDLRSFLLPNKAKQGKLHVPSLQRPPGRASDNPRRSVIICLENWSLVEK
jgi:hypothetical protein